MPTPPAHTTNTESKDKHQTVQVHILTSTIQVSNGNTKFADKFLDNKVLMLKLTSLPNNSLGLAVLYVYNVYCSCWQMGMFNVCVCVCVCVFVCCEYYSRFVFSKRFRYIYMMCSLRADGMLCTFCNVCICLCSVYGVFMLNSYCVTCTLYAWCVMLWSCCDLSVMCIVFMLRSCRDL